MKFTLALVALFGLVALALAAPLTDEHHAFLFKSWKSQHNKSYSPTEHHYRFAVFKRNLEFIQAHNEKNLGYELAMNHFGDLTPSEYKNMHLATNVPALMTSSVHRVSRVGIPDSFDWRTKNAVTPVKNQGQCGSCWTFSTTGAVEGAWAIAKGQLVSLSEQNLVDCSHNGDNNGCNGGMMEDAYQYIINNQGIDTEACYPYRGVDGSCSYKSNCVGATISSFVAVPSGDENAMADAIANHGPLAIAIDASAMAFQFYSKGVYNQSACKNAINDLDHGVLAVGYGTDSTGKAYWIVKNSWGTGWGQQGYIWMSRNANNQCGVATYASYPVV